MNSPEDIGLEPLLDRLHDIDGYMQITYGQVINQFQESSGIKRALMARRYPEVKDYVEYMDAQRSVSEAKRSANANEGNLIIF